MLWEDGICNKNKPDSLITTIHGKLVAHSEESFCFYVKKLFGKGAIQTCLLKGRAKVRTRHHALTPGSTYCHACGLNSTTSGVARKQAHQQHKHVATSGVARKHAHQQHRHVARTQNSSEAVK
jgi:hypothetical protein